MTVYELIIEECLKEGIHINESDIEHILWAETGYPCFWPDGTKTPEENLRMQVSEWAKKQPKHHVDSPDGKEIK
jgi:hypothetical protein